MLFDITLYDGTELNDIDGAVDATGITYPKPTSSIILPDSDPDEMRMVMLPWASISKVEYTITPEMIAMQNGAVQAQANLDQPSLNRKQRRASLQQ